MGLLKHISAPTKLRLVAALLMLALGFTGVVVTDIKKDGAWDYWRALCIIYALMSLGMSRHLKHRGWKSTAMTIWHEIAHWAGLFGSILIASWFVHIGMLGRFEAGLLALLLLALATYLAGIYIEPTCIFVGLMLGFFAAGIAFLDTYLYNVLIPLTLVAGLLLIFILRYRRKDQS